MGEVLVAEIMRLLAQAVVGSLIAAIFLRLAAKIVVKESPTYGTAYLCSFLTVIINGVLGLGVGMIAGYQEASDETIGALSLGMIPVSLLIAGGIVGHYLSIPYVKGLIVVLLQMALTLLVIGIPIALFLMFAQ